jgi:predicted dehydrogenase
LKVDEFNMSKPLKVGVIGVGGIATTHFPGWHASPDAELVALADPAGGILKQAGREQGIDLLYENPADLISNPEIDIIDICTPNMYHTPLAIAALEAGKHVICEKPLAPTPADIDRIIAARDKSGKLLMTAQHFRFQGDTQVLKREVETGILGEIYHARCWMLRRNGFVLRPGFIYRKHSGGGPCIDIGVHILDLTLWMMGHPRPVSVSGMTQDKLSKLPGAYAAWSGELLPSDMDVEEFATALVRFENGATLILEVSWLLHHKTTGEDMQMWLYGTEGGLHWPNSELLATNYATKRQYDIHYGPVPAGMEAHAAECVAFADAVAHGKPSPVPAEQSRDVMRILDALYQSAAADKEVRLD